MKKAYNKVIFYFGFFLFIIGCFLRNTDFNINKDILWLITIVVLGLKCLVTSYTKKEIKIYFIMLTLFGLASYMSKDFYLMAVPIALISCKSIPLKNIIKILFWVNLLMTIITIFSSLFFGIGNISVTRIYRTDMEVVTRYYFGFVHPNQLSVTCFSLIASYLYLNWNKMKYYKYLIIFILALIINYFTDSNTSFYVSIILLILTIYLKKVETKKDNKSYKILMFLTLFVFSFSIFSMLFVNDFVFLQNIDYYLSNRFIVANKFYNLNGLSLFGKYIFSSLEVTLDQGIVNILLRYGVILFSVLIYIICKFYKNEKKDLKKIIMVFIFIFYSLVENEMLDIYRNFGIYILFYSFLQYDCSYLLSRGDKN